MEQQITKEEYFLHQIEVFHRELVVQLGPKFTVDKEPSDVEDYYRFWIRTTIDHYAFGSEWQVGPKDFKNVTPSQLANYIRFKITTALEKTMNPDPAQDVKQELQEYRNKTTEAMVIPVGGTPWTDGKENYEVLAVTTLESVRTTYPKVVIFRTVGGQVRTIPADEWSNRMKPL